MNQPVKRNINLARFFSDLTPIAPYLALFLASRSLSISNIAILFSIWAGAVILFEIPTGILADHTNKKTILVLSKIIKLSCFVVFLLTTTFTSFAFGFILWGLAAALDSGALQSFIYETTEKKEGFSKLYSSTMSWNFAGMVASSIMAALLVRYGFNLLLIFSIASTIATIIFLVTLPDTITKPMPLAEQSHQTPKKFVANILTALKNPFVLSPLLLGAIAGGTKGAFDELHGLLLNSTGLSLGIIGFIIASFDGMKFLGSQLATQLKDKTNYQYIFVAIIGFLLVVAGFFGVWIAVIALALLMLVDACFWIQNDTAILHAAHEHHRATTLSIKSFFTEISSLGLFTVAGFATKMISLPHLYIVVGAVFPVITTVSFMTSLKYKNPRIAPRVF